MRTWRAVVKPLASVPSKTSGASVAQEESAPTITTVNALQRMKRPVFENRNVNDLLRQSKLLHVGLVVPEQPLVIHHAGVSPVSDRRHHHVDFLSGRSNGLATADWHRIGERSGHVADYSGPMTVCDLDRMLLDREVGHWNEHRLQVLDVLFDSVGVVTIGP